jgi:hypothetical protein
LKNHPRTRTTGYCGPFRKENGPCWNWCRPDDLTVAEAAAALNIRQVAARVRLHRARQALLSAPARPVFAEEVMS